MEQFPSPHRFRLSGYGGRFGERDDEPYASAGAGAAHLVGGIGDADLPGAVVHRSFVDDGRALSERACHPVQLGRWHQPREQDVHVTPAVAGNVGDGAALAPLDDGGSLGRDSGGWVGDAESAGSLDVEVEH
ncbi:hypothetical protein E1292_17560 [Nonomuraea deserti]|uniref:Uncharacterized protein n=1 Tax=Nonomuraea deserti TaxID=1848322 RepID=A0A4R4VSE4_9ACTN|nr:hypothetical protein [Nonomuraea deserti]TDD05265.1 hypothetical protein E1292_17560 [Nonomuraea deserti]